VGRRQRRHSDAGARRHADRGAGEPGQGVGRLRLRAGVREADEGRERRRDAGARQLRGRTDALPRLGTGLGRRSSSTVSSSRSSSGTFPSARRRSRTTSALTP
jgi:hypothetical protein